MALRSPLPVQTSMYLTDINGLPLDGGRVYFGQPNKDPQQSPIDIFYDQGLTVFALQPIITKNGFLVKNGNTVGAYAKETRYSVKVVNANGVTVFYIADMHRDDDFGAIINEELQRSQEAERQIRELIDLNSQNNKSSISAISAELKTTTDELGAKDLVLQNQINTIGGGKKSYTTKALMEADKANISPNSSIDVTNDTATANNGTYTYNGTTFTKSAYDPQAVILSKVTNAFSTFAGMSASPLPNDSYAVVTGDSDPNKNGYYQKKLDAWALEPYNPVAISKRYTDITAPRVSIMYDEVLKLPNPNITTIFRQPNWTLVTDPSTNKTTLDLKTLPSDGTSFMDYTFNVGEVLKAGDIVKAECEYWSDSRVSPAYVSIDIIIRGSSGSQIQEVKGSLATTVGAWVKLTNTYTIPYPNSSVGSISIRFRSGAGMAGTKFRDIAIYRTGNANDNTSAVINTVASDTKISDVKAELQAKIGRKVNVNLFPYPELKYAPLPYAEYDGRYVNNFADGAHLVLDTSDVATFRMTKFFVLVDGEYIKEGDTLSFEVEGWSGLSAAAAGKVPADMSIEALKNDVRFVLVNPTSGEVTQGNVWEKLTAEYTVHAGVDKIAFRLVSRSGTTDDYTVKFRRPVLINKTTQKEVTYSPFATSGGGEVSGAGSVTLFVSQLTGTAEATGADEDNALNSIQLAVSMLPPSGGTVIVLDDTPYREFVQSNTQGKVVIKGAYNNNANIYGSNKLITTPHATEVGIIQAPLAQKPVSMPNRPKKPSIIEMGKPSKPIPIKEKHHLHKGKNFRLPFTELFLVDTFEALKLSDGGCYWAAGVIYIKPSTNAANGAISYEARARQCFDFKRGDLVLHRVNSWFSTNYGFGIEARHCVRSACTAFGAGHNGFMDNSNFTVSYKDRAGANNNDGFNSTHPTGVGDLDSGEFNNRIEILYFDPYGHDNGDDGHSCHYRCDSTIYGGLFEHNAKADLVHVTGAACATYNTRARGSQHGFYAGWDAAGDAERVYSSFTCYNPIADDNQFAYRAEGGASMILVNPDARNTTDIVYHFANIGASGVVTLHNPQYSGNDNGATPVIIGGTGAGVTIIKSKDVTLDSVSADF